MPPRHHALGGRLGQERPGQVPRAAADHVEEDDGEHGHDEQRGQSGEGRERSAHGPAHGVFHAPRSRQPLEDPPRPGGGHHVEDEGEEEQLHADEEQERVVRAAHHHLAHLRGDGGGHGAHRVREVPRDDGRVARGHQDDHRLADGAAEAQHARGEDARRRRRQHHLPGRLPARGPQRERRLAVAARHRGERVLGHREDDRDDRQRQGQARHHRVEPVGEAEGVLEEGGEHHQREEAQHHRGNARQQLDGGLEHLAQPPGRELGGEQRARHPHRHRHRHGHQRRLQRADEERNHAHLGHLGHRLPHEGRRAALRAPPAAGTSWTGSPPRAHGRRGRAPAPPWR